VRDFNQNIITEFRANAGQVGGMFANQPLLLLTTMGAKSGQARIAPLAYVKDADRLIIIASKGGAPANPDWYYNLLANPSVTVEVGTERFQARASIVESPDRERFYAQMVEKIPVFGEYQQKTSRQIPVFVLEREG